MPLIERETIKTNAHAFAKNWEDAHSERGEAPIFVSEFLAVFGIENIRAEGALEYKALRNGKPGRMDYFSPKIIGIEMKSKGKNLDKAFEQLKDYVLTLPSDQMPALMMVCDFENIVLYLREKDKRIAFKTKDLHQYVEHFNLLSGRKTEWTPQEQLDLNVRAAEKMARLHETLEGYGYEQHDLEVFLVRLLFCMFAEDTGIFRRDAFLNYVRTSKPDGSDLAGMISELFLTLNLKDEVRAKRKDLISVDLQEFPYVNGKLFDGNLPPFIFNEKMRQALIDCCVFDWSKISPAIFGAMFQGVMKKERRRELGAHYTSEENILKLINPLFMDDLRTEFQSAKKTESALKKFHEKISQLKFLDPACGCGNFLMIAYRELRLLELDILIALRDKEKNKRKALTRQQLLDIAFLTKVNVAQFYGIEIEDFPCEIAKVGMWLTEHQMNEKVAEEFGNNPVHLPLGDGAKIEHANALTIDWETVLPKEECSYVFGNPPFNGARMMNKSQKTQITNVVEAESPFPLRYKNMSDNLDYVTAWYFKAARYIHDLRIPVSFVSTNSICQGEQVAPLWDTLLSDYGIEINFAYRTFKWSNAAKRKAAVHCVIVGFSGKNVRKTRKKIHDGNAFAEVDNISPYLVDSPNIIVQPSKKPLCDVPEMKFGSQPRDGGHFVLTPKERDDILEREPALAAVIKPYIGSEEFLHNRERYCIWLLNAPVEFIKNSKILRERIAAVQDFRLSSRAKTTNQYGKVPAIFAQIAHPNGNYLLVPSTSSESRRYVPIGFMDGNTIASNAAHIIPSATLYHFGILTSSVHNAWMRAVCGRLEMRYRYSKELVYNTFPWPTVNEKQKTAIETAAQAVLDERAKQTNMTLADLYDPVLFATTGLLKVHESLDRAVLKLYGFTKDWPESKIVAALMERYRELTR